MDNRLSVKVAAAFFVCMLSLLSACDMHSSDNGSLDGYWQLTQADTLSVDTTTGTILAERSGDVRVKGIFWAFQADLLKMRDTHDKRIDSAAQNRGIFFRFKHESGQLRIYDPYIDQRYIVPEYPDLPVENLNDLKYYGIYSLEETFDVLQLTDEHMILQGRDFRFHFRKY